MPDTAEDERFANDVFLQEHGIRFCAVAPLADHQENVVGSLCVLDTRPRQLSDKQKETLTAVAESVMSAIEMSEPSATAELGEQEEVPSWLSKRRPRKPRARQSSAQPGLSIRTYSSDICKPIQRTRCSCIR